VLFLRPDFLIWLLATLLIVGVTAFLHIWGWLGDILIAALIMTVAVMALLIRWARFIAVIMTVDLDANNGEGLIHIDRLIPAPNLPESVQITLQDAAEGSSEVNTVGIVNTLITVFKPLNFLRVLSIGDLTFRARGSDFKMTMYGLQDPDGVKKQVQGYWKAISKVMMAEKMKKERTEEIERMTVAVAAGVKQAFTELRNTPNPELPPAPTLLSGAAAPPSDSPPAPESPAPPRSESPGDGDEGPPLNGHHNGAQPR
jgi:hypothetical protein